MNSILKKLAISFLAVFLCLSPIHWEVFAEGDFYAWPENYNLTVLYGETADLQVFVQGQGADSVSFQWQYLEENEWVNVGENKSTLTVEGYGSNPRSYQCIVTGDDGTEQIIDFTVNIDIVLLIDSFDTDVYLTRGNTVEVTIPVHALDESDLIYTWKKYDENAEEYHVLEDGNGKSYVFSDFGNYLFEAHSSNYGVGVSETINVKSYNEIWAEDYDGNIILHYGDSQTIAPVIHALDETGLTYQWFFKNNDSDESVGIDGANESYYTVSSAGTYFLRVSDNLAGIHEDYYYYVTLLNNIWTDNYNPEIYADAGETVVLDPEVHADDESGLTYKWYKYDNDTGTNVLLEGETGSSLVVNTPGAYLLVVNDSITGDNYEYNYNVYF